MKEFIPTWHKILAAASALHWWTYYYLFFWFTGSFRKRVRFVEKNVPLMHEAGLLKRLKYGKKYVYTSWSQPSHLEHGLVCSKVLLKLRASDPSSTVIGENEFRSERFGVVPEFGLLYPWGTMLLAEYCTADNVGRNGLVVKKVNMYSERIEDIENHFQARAIVLFILDTKDALAYALRSRPKPFAYFIDLETFLSVKQECHLAAPVYIYGGDGKRHPLKGDA